MTRQVIALLLLLLCQPLFCDNPDLEEMFTDKEDVIEVPYFEDDDWLIPENQLPPPQEQELWSDLRPKEIDENGDYKNDDEENNDDGYFGNSN